MIAMVSTHLHYINDGKFNLICGHEGGLSTADHVGWAVRLIGSIVAVEVIRLEVILIPTVVTDCDINTNRGNRLKRWPPGAFVSRIRSLFRSLY